MYNNPIKFPEVYWPNIECGHQNSLNLYNYDSLSQWCIKLTYSDWMSSIGMWYICKCRPSLYYLTVIIYLSLLYFFLPNTFINGHVLCLMRATHLNWFFFFTENIKGLAWQIFLELWINLEWFTVSGSFGDVLI